MTAAWSAAAVTAPGGRPHAETAGAGDGGRSGARRHRLRHAGAVLPPRPTPPCTDALIAAGIARVVVAHARSATRGSTAQGIAGCAPPASRSKTGCCASRGRGDQRRLLPCASAHGRPLVTLKLASTLDGRIATPCRREPVDHRRAGAPRWRTRCAAGTTRCMVGVGTVLADNPDLTCRIPGFRPTPIVRVVADSHLRTPLTARLVATARRRPDLVHRRATAPIRPAHGVARTCGVTADRGRRRRRCRRRSAGGAAGAGRARPDPGAGRRRRAVAAALLRADLVDRIAWFHAPAVMGGDGWPAVQAFGVETLGRCRASSATALTVDRRRHA